MADVLKRKSVSSRKNVQMLRFGEVDGCENTIITITAHVIVSLFSLSLTHLINILGISYNTLQDRADKHRCLLFSSCWSLESGGVNASY
jgi:cell division protein FtsB